MFVTFFIVTRQIFCTIFRNFGKKPIQIDPVQKFWKVPKNWFYGAGVCWISGRGGCGLCCTQLIIAPNMAEGSTALRRSKKEEPVGPWTSSILYILILIIVNIFTIQCNILTFSMRRKEFGKRIKIVSVFLILLLMLE